MQTLLAEAIGTMILVLLGDGVVANVVLNRTKGQNSGWIVITTGWGIAVAIAVYAVGRVSGAHLTPAVTIALATIGSFPWHDVPGYIGAQMVGAFVGAVLVWLAYLPHWGATTDPGSKLAVFSTGPAIRSTAGNCITEIIGDPHYQSRAKVRELCQQAGFVFDEVEGGWRIFTASFRKP